MVHAQQVLGEVAQPLDVVFPVVLECVGGEVLVDGYNDLEPVFEGPKDSDCHFDEVDQ